MAPPSPTRLWRDVALERLVERGPDETVSVKGGFAVAERYAPKARTLDPRRPARQRLSKRFRASSDRLRCTSQICVRDLRRGRTG